MSKPLLLCLIAKSGCGKSTIASRLERKYNYIQAKSYTTRPVHMFLRSIDQSTVDSSMEVWLQKISDRLTFKHWYFGHYHDDWDNGKYSMLYTDIIPLGYKVGE